MEALQARSPAPLLLHVLTQPGCAVIENAASSGDPPPELPGGWTEHFDPVHQEYYYHHHELKTSVWKRHSGSDPTPVKASDPVESYCVASEIIGALDVPAPHSGWRGRGQGRRHIF